MTVQDLISRSDQARREGRLLEARRDLLFAAARSSECQSPHEFAVVLGRLGRIERDRGRRDGAAARYERAATLVRELGEESLVAHFVRHLGDIHCDAGRLDLALSCYGEALAILRASPETTPLALANALRSLALLKEKTGATRDAIHSWQEARVLYRNTNVKEGIAECTERIATLKRRLDGS